MSGGKLQFTAAEYRVSEKGNWTGARLGVERVNGTDGGASVVVRNTSSGSSGRGTRYSDYDVPGTTETLTWASGEGGIKYPEFSPIDDPDVENEEFVPFSLSDIVGAEYGSIRDTRVTIISDDSYLPKHQWVDGTKLQFENADGTWGTPVDLKGNPGKDGVWGQYEMLNPGQSPTLKLVSANGQKDIQFSCEYRQQNLFLHSSGGVVSFWGELHVENLRIINPYDEFEDNQLYRDYESYSLYNILQIELKELLNETPIDTPAVVSGEFYSGIRDVQQSQFNLSANATLKMVVPANSNKAWIEYWRGSWTSQINVINLDNQPAAFNIKFSGRLLGTVIR